MWLICQIQSLMRRDTWSLFYYKWEGQTSQMGEWQRAEGRGKKKNWKQYLCQWRPPTHKTCSDGNRYSSDKLLWTYSDSYFWVTVWKWNISSEICTKEIDFLFKITLDFHDNWIMRQQHGEEILQHILATNLKDLNLGFINIFCLGLKWDIVKISSYLLLQSIFSRRLSPELLLQCLWAF